MKQQKNDYSGLDSNTFEEARGQKSSANGVPTNNGLAWGGAPANLAAYTAKTFGWMFLGLLVTFGVAITFFVTGAWTFVFQIPALPFILMIAEVGLVIVLSARLQKMSVGAARALFFVYAALNGITFTSLMILYDMMSLVLVFGLTALFFGALALYGFVTKQDLSNLRGILMGGLIFLFVFWVLSLFLPLSGFETIACFIGIIVFMGFTAYDTQKIKQMYNHFGGNEEMAAKTSIICALQLYLDFINLFIYLLRLVGRRNN